MAFAISFLVLRRQVDDVRTYQPPEEAKVWLNEMLAHTKSDKRDETLDGLRDQTEPPAQQKAA